MAGIRLEWAQFGDFDSFDVIRSDAPMDINALPSPIATNLPTMYHMDTTVVEGATYYYRVVAWRDAVSKVSGEIKLKVLSSDEHWDNVVALLHFDGGFTDETGRVWVKNGTQTNIQAGSSLFGAGGLRVNGNDSDLQTTYPLDNSAQPFTFELFMRITSYEGPNQTFTWSKKLHAIISQGGNNGSQDQGFYLDNGFLAINRTAWSTGGSGAILRTGVDKVPLNKFVHIAICYDGTTQYGFLDGVLQFAFSVNTGWFNGVAGFRVGRFINTGYTQYRYGANADYDELRITKGVARYTENFTPPDAPFPSY